MNENPSQIPELIRNFRKERGLNQGEFARRLGYTQGYIADLERGRQAPSRKFWERLSEMFKGSSAEILNKSVSAQWDEIQKKLRNEGTPTESIEKIQGHILSILRIHDERAYQKGFEKIIMVQEPEVPYRTITTEQETLINNVFEILDSDDEVTVNALKGNIQAFLEGIRAKKKNHEDKGGDQK